MFQNTQWRCNKLFR